MVISNPGRALVTCKQLQRTTSNEQKKSNIKSWNCPLRLINHGMVQFTWKSLWRTVPRAPIYSWTARPPGWLRTCSACSSSSVYPCQKYKADCEILLSELEISAYLIQYVFTYASLSSFAVLLPNLLNCIKIDNSVIY